MSVENALKLLLGDNAYGLVYQLAAFKYKQCRYGHDAVALCQGHISVDVYNFFSELWISLELINN